MSRIHELLATADTAKVFRHTLRRRTATEYATI